MTISAAEIVAYMTFPLDVNEPGISIQVRNRLEWTWGLGHTHLDEHLSEFTDPLHVFTDDSLFVIPSKDTIRDIHRRTWHMKFGARRPHIRKLYNGRTSFEYLVIPVDSRSPLPGRIVVSEVPPHIAVATTYGKIMQQWGHLTGAASTAIRTSLVERCAIVFDPPFSLYDLSVMQGVYRSWALVDYVPASFLSEDSGETMIEAEDSPDTTPAPEQSVSNDKIDWDVGSSASCEHEPRRRLLPRELEQDLNDLPSVVSDDDEEDEDDVDSHLTGVTDELEADHRWLEGIARWAEVTAAAHEPEGMLLSMIHENPGVHIKYGTPP
ncbi:hypothetical protein B0H15DRAFT_955100 [Mycena belliarum]|uniref:Uncharacterized protein n=1 Tax=Mycena belliarum TaxID=1033014 RepID=A0AAD6XKG0_9AGAR|nr:hypothetical protein B0H15DRAFT_955100 [Mycena belliae]